MNYLSFKQLYKTEIMYGEEGQRRKQLQILLREGEVMWKSCSRATKPLLKIKPERS